MPKKVTEYPFLPLLRKFINEAKKGKHLQTNGKKIKPLSVKNYHYLELLLIKFAEEKKIVIRVKNIAGLSKTQFEVEKKYWKDFYFQFTSFLYDDLNHFDNYVGRLIKLLRSVLNYLNSEKNLNIGLFYKKFYAPSEDVEIIILSPERINYLIDTKELELSLSDDLQKVKDVFIFGCAVALRFSDLKALNKSNLEIINQRMYIKIQSKKTQTYTRVKLPEFAINIIKKYSKQYVNKLLPEFTKAYMNKKVKVIMETYGFTEIIERTRQKRGIPVHILKNNKHYRFCDSVSTHTMRRSAITTLLSLGMNEQMVRQISGHAANSKEFFRYVAFAQNYIDTEIDQVHQKLEEKKLEIA